MKPQYPLLIVLFFTHIFSANAQCPPGDITFSSQLEINQFQANYPGCTVISGNLTVSGPDITNVVGIGMLTSITGDYVFVNNTIMTNPFGFSTPFTIGGNLRFENNDALTQTTNFFGYLTSIGGELQVIENDSLSYLGGFQTTTSIGGIHIENNPSLTIGVFFGDQNISGNVKLINNDSMTDVLQLNFVGGDLNISENDMLNNLFGLNSLTSVGGGLTLSGNQDLTNLNGLGALASVGGDVSIQYNPSLTGLFGLTVLDSIGGSFFIQNNTNFLNFFGLNAAFDTIAGELRIVNNPAITSMAGLENLDTIGLLRIENNDNLFSLQGLDAVTAIGELHIEGNDGLTGLFGPFLLANVPTLRIYSNPSLTTLNGLNSVSAIGSLYIFNNAGLLNLNGLNGLTSLNALILDTNPALNNLGGMNLLNAIPGGLAIVNNNVLPDLNGLGNVTTIGNFTLIDNDALTYPLGMFMLDTITGNFLVQGNEDLIGFLGLNALTHIAGDLNVNNNAALTSLSGSNLASIGGDLLIQNNPLINLNTLLANLTAIGGSINVSGNNSLTSLFSFNNLTSIGYGIAISGNNSLTTLNGLGNIDHTTIQSLNLQLCPLLSYCHVPSICDYLANGGDGGGIGVNAMGCDSEEEVEAACFCPPGNVTFTTQAEIDAFATAYPNCTTLQGGILINGANINDLTGLNGLTTVNGYLSIVNCPLLDSLNGLSGLTSINGYLNIANCPLLASLSGLNGLMSINGFLNIGNCDLLSSLSGLENIAYTTISHLYLNGSAELSTCEIPNICHYVFLNLPATISGNATGCSAVGEIQTVCSCASNRLSNPGFDAPVQPFLGDNLTGQFTFNGWTMTVNTFNVIKTDGSPYSAGPDNGQDGAQYVDVAYATGTAYQDFSISGVDIPVYFGGYFSSRTGQPWTASVDLFSMPSNTLVATSSTYNITAADTDNWRFVYGNVTLPAGDYRYVANIHDDGNFDAAFVFADCRECTWDGSTGNWNEDLKWSCGHVPNATDDVIITGGTVTVPTGFDGVGKTLHVAVPAQLSVEPTGTVKIEN